MKDVPEKIKESLERLKKAYGARLELRYLNKRFCVFEATSKWDPEHGKPRKITKYLGWLEDDGLMVPARHRVKEGSIKEIERQYLEKLNELEEKERGKERGMAVAATSGLSEKDIALVKVLSMNPRLTYHRMSEITSINAQSIPYAIRRLEKLLDIKYTMIIEPSKIGFFENIIFAKFLNGRPDMEVLKGVLEKEPRIQLALLTTGEYDLMIFCVAETNGRLADILYEVRNAPTMADVESVWYTTPVAVDYGFTLLRKEFFNLLEKRIWHRKKGGPRPTKSDLMLREFAVLKEMNEDSTISFSKIDEKYKLPVGSAKHSYEELFSTDVHAITLPTINIRKPNMRYIAVIKADILVASDFKSALMDLLQYIISDSDGVINKLTYYCVSETPNGMLFILPVFSEGTIDEVEKELRSLIKGIRIYSMIVSDVLVGELLFRKFDNYYSPPYYGLVSNKIIKPVERVNYYY